MGERTPNPESEETPESKPEVGEGSAAEQAKMREREMEESGEENAT